MRGKRTIWSWLTTLLVISGIVAPSLLAAAATPTECPMARSAQMRLCEATPQPEPARADCCGKHEAGLSRSGEIAGNCCCDMTAAAPDRDGAPALVSSPVTPVILPATVALPAPPHIALSSTPERRRGDETAPRGPPLRAAPPRAPPVS